MRTLVKPEDAGLLALITQAHIGQKSEPEALTEGLRLIQTYEHPSGEKAKVYKDIEWGEHRVKFFDKEGKHLPDADYHTHDVEDAHGTAQEELKRSAARMNENEDPADPNDHDMNAVASLHTGNIYHHAANLIEDHGNSSELHTALVAGLRKLGDEHHADYNTHARHAAHGRDAHEDISHQMTSEALSDLVRQHDNNRK